jgi:AcrR family transcriptional regulator
MDASLPPRTGGKRDRTRAALVEAALEIISERGFAAASLDEIAARAGMTKGAIYSNFSGKAELLLAAMGAKGLTLASPRPAAETVGEELSAMARDLVATLAHAKGQEAFLAEFQIHALSDPELRKGLAAAYAESFTGTAEYLSRLKDRNAAMTPRQLAVALQAIALGFVIQSFLTPGDVTGEVVTATLNAFAAALS